MSEQNSSSSSLSEPARSAVSVRHNKTLSQFPAAKLPSSPHASPLPLKNRLTGPQSTHGGWTSLTGTLPSNVSVMPGITGDGVPVSPWHCPVERLLSQDPGSEWRGALCVIWALAETLDELPHEQAASLSIALSEVNTRGEITLIQSQNVPVVRPTHARVLTEFAEKVCRGLSRPTSEAVSSMDGPVAGTTPDWVRLAAEGVPGVETAKDVANWLEAHLDVPRVQRREHIRSWMRLCRRTAQNREGLLMQQLGETLFQLSMPPAERQSKSRLKTFAYVALFASLVASAVVAVFLLRA